MTIILRVLLSTQINSKTSRHCLSTVKPVSQITIFSAVFACVCFHEITVAVYIR